MSAAPYDLKLSAASSLYSYLPSRDGGFSTSWNSSYTGEISWPVAGADAGTPAGIAYRGTNAARVSVSISFEGTGFFLCYKANGAGVALTLDNKLSDTTGDVGTLCADFKGEADAVLVATGLENTSHNALLQVSASASQEFRFFGGGITLAVATNGKVVDTQIVDNTDNGWTYSPNSGTLVWDMSLKGPTLVGGTGAFQCNFGAERRAAYSFSGASGIILHGAVWQDSHEFSVILDTETINMDATSSWGDGSAIFFARTGLDPTQSHTIALVDYNSDVPDCRSKYGGRFCCTALDAITLLRAGTADLPPTSSNQPTGTNLPQNTGTSGGSSSNVGAIAGGVVGGILAALAIILLAWFILRRKRKNKDEPGHLAGGVGQPILSDEHTSRPAFFSNAPTSYAPSMTNSGVVFANPGQQSTHRSDSHWAPGNDVSSIHQSVASLPAGAANAMSPGSMYSQQGMPPQMHEQQQTPSWLQPVVATGDRKVRQGIGAGGSGVVAPPAPATGSPPSSMYAGQTNSSQPHLARSAGSNSSGGAPYGQGVPGSVSGDFGAGQPGAPGGPRLAQEDLEQVLAFIAQRMDRVPGQPASNGPRSEDGDNLPEYRG